MADGRVMVSRRLKRTWQKKRRFALALVWLLLRSFHSTSGGTIGFVSCAIKSSELVSSSRRESPEYIHTCTDMHVHGTARNHIHVRTYRKNDEASSTSTSTTTSPSSSSSSFFVLEISRLRHLQQPTRDHLRGARVFDKPVKARPRICLPLAFVTLLVLWLDSELTWKKGPRWYPEQTVGVCPGSTRCGAGARLYRRP